MEEEIWKPVKGFEGVYEISSCGRIKSFHKISNGYMSNNNKSSHYITVVLSNKKQRKTTRLHRLVAEHFISNPDNKPEVNHKDFNKQNNHYTNLEWSTRRENNNHMRAVYPNKIGQWNRETRSRTIVQLSLKGEYVAEFLNAFEAGKATGVCKRNIHQVAAKTEYKPGLTRSQAGGFKWVFKDEYDVP